MNAVRALLQVRAGAIGTNPKPLNMALEDGTPGRVLSPDFITALRDAMNMAVTAAALGDMSEIRITIMPTDLPSAN